MKKTRAHERYICPPWNYSNSDDEESGSGPSQDTTATNSPYPEVRAAVPATDDEHVAYNTLRVWTIGTTLCIFGAVLNTLFSLRSPRIGLGSLIVLLLGWALGRAWERWMPPLHVNLPLFGLALEFELNPGPFTLKEHAAIMVMASVALSVANATDVLLAQRLFYRQDWGGIPYQALLMLSTQCLGYGLAGMLRRVLVYPPAMIWPSNLAVVTLLNTLHDTRATTHHRDRDPTVLGGTMPKLHWFFTITAAMSVYAFIPSFLAQCLSTPGAFPTWLAPNNAIVNQLFGSTTGLSLLPLTLDWTQIAGFVGSPLIPPWNAIWNTTLGVVLFYCILTPALHYSNAWYARYLPMSDAETYDNTGARYDISRVLGADLSLDERAYREYSPVFISTAFAVNYGLSFATIVSLVCYTWIHHRGRVWLLWRQSRKKGERGEPDVHMRLMARYREVPQSWYLGVFLAMLVASLVIVLAYPTQIPLWAFVLAVGVSVMFSVPIGIIQAATNTQIGLNVLTEFVFGYLQPGKPLGLMIFKNFGYITMSQALDFVSDLKFGHYVKLPPRMTFACQLSATLISCFVQLVVLNLAVNHIEDLCELHQPSRFTCPGGRVFFSSSVLWGLIGPARVFSPGQVYSGLLLSFALGGAATVAVHFAGRRWVGARQIIMPLVLGGAGSIPPATPLNYLSWGIVGFVFQHLIKTRHARWWSRLNYLTSSGLDLGLALATIVMFAMTAFGVKPPRWWGNSVGQDTMDAQYRAVQAVVPAGARFGPQNW
ncbi:sexual differentiation process protein isp4 [Podospora aff. communis PSN243]|uniref:Sexual differentiation process protein isp4 n=1 Tax=Podospora aff. communis PSN243 TaxID=3040156 RepID=A0AAV9G4S7_9PEZI|nr:sexual differentiation process protein isp4 [Podospora aff. communis PSN243]